MYNRMPITCIFPSRGQFFSKHDLQKYNIVSNYQKSHSKISSKIIVPTVEKDPSPKILPKVKSSFLRDWGDLSEGVFGRLASPLLTSILRR